MKYLNYAIKGLNPKKFYYLSTKSLQDTLNKKYPARPNDAHIKGAMEWLSIAQKQNSDGGVAALYSMFEGWHESYVETTGYIIPTFFNYADATNTHFYKDEAIQMADFELKNQLKSGAFPGGDKRDMPIVFNTGQVIFGLCRTFEETMEQKYREAAARAADWLVSVMHEQGYWEKDEYLGKVHAYNTRTAWSLLYAHKITQNIEYKKAAIMNIDWALNQQTSTGWFKNMAFYPGQEPLTHTIAYTIRGILEAAIFLRKKNYLEAAIKCATPIIDEIRNDGSLAGSFNSNWKSSVKWSCLTGNSQMAGIFYKLFSITKDEKFLEAGKKLNDFMKTMQNLSSSNPGIKGGIPGAYPIYGWYAPFCYPNWAAKFFVDALMLENDLKIADKLTG